MVGRERRARPTSGRPNPARSPRVGNFEVATLPLAPNARSRPPTSSTRAAAPRSTRRSASSGCSSPAGVLGGTVLALLAGLAVADRAMRPISSLTAAAREIAATRDPSQAPADARVRRRGRGAGPDPRPDAARARRRPVGDRADDPGPARLRRRRLARAAHAADQHPRQPRAARGELRERAAPTRTRRRSSPARSARRGGCAGWSPTCCCSPAPTPGGPGPRRSCDLAEIATAAVAEVRPVAGGSHDRARGPAARSRSTATPTTCTGWSLNLVENGVRHTPPGSTVSVSVRADGDGDALLVVEDDGPGLPDGAGDQIFARFVRGSGGPADLTADPAPASVWRSSRRSPSPIAGGSRRPVGPGRRALRRPPAAWRCGSGAGRDFLTRVYGRS